MSPQVGARLRPVAYALLAIAGTWSAHGIEYARVAGADHLTAGLTSPLHGYMLPAGAVLLGLALVVGSELAAIARRGQRTANRLRAQLSAALRGRPAQIPIPSTTREQSWSVRNVFIALTAAQVLLYLVQENVEAALAGLPAPGLAAVTGLHWAAPLVHASVAAVLSIGVFLLRRVWRRDRRVAQRVEALLRMLLGRQHGAATRWQPVRSRAIAQQIAAACWGRSPPLRGIA